MGKKRKKSKGRNKRRRRQKESVATSSSSSADEAPAEREDDDTGPVTMGDGEGEADEAHDEEAVTRGGGEGEADEDDGTEPGATGDGEGEADDAHDEEAVDGIIDLGDDLDDPEARADLVAAAAGLAGTPPAGQHGDDTEGHLGDGSDDSVSAGGSEAADESGAAESGATEGGADENGVDEDGAAEAADDADDADAPLIGPDALLALSEFRDEGVATIPEELVLELGETGSADERDLLLAAALAHVEMQDAIYRVPLESGTTRRWKGLIAAAILLMAMLLTGLPPTFLVPEAPQPLTTGERLRGIRMALLLQAEQVEAFRVREEGLPTSLAELETSLPGIRFIRSSNRLYQLVAYTPEGEAVVYDSASPDPAFSEVTAPWIPREDE